MGEGSSRWRRGVWRTEVDVRVRELRHRLDVARELPPGKWQSGQTGDERRAAATAAARCLNDAETATAEPTEWADRLNGWWSGSALTTAWESVHEAELTILPLEEEADVRASLPRLRAWIQRAMDGSDRRSRYEDALEAQASGAAPYDLTVVRQALKDVIVANNDRYANLRAFRNILVLVTAMIAGLVGVLVLAHVVDPGLVSLCTGAGDGAGGDEDVCFGGSEPRAWDVALVAVFGAIGGLLALAFGLADTEAPPSRYDPRIWQVGLKAAAGAATALAGILLIQADLVVAPASSPSEALFLSYAAIFGFSQQLFTRFVDKRAGAIIGTDRGESGGGSPQ